jgi:ArsR family transcriptional regulator
MEKHRVLAAFSALSQPTRLDGFRLLVLAGPTGLLAGELSSKLGVRQNTMSANLSVLLHAGLVRNNREGRSIRYFADMDGMTQILSFLLRDCCGGRPDLCQSVLSEYT